MQDKLDLFDANSFVPVYTGVRDKPKKEKSLRTKVQFVNTYKEKSLTPKLQTINVYKEKKPGKNCRTFYKKLEIKYGQKAQ